MYRKHSAFYDAYIKSNEWAEKREQALEHYGRRCHKCGGTARLQVHHRTYRRLGHERISDLEILCFWCHARQHRSVKFSRSRRKRD